MLPKPAVIFQNIKSEDVQRCKRVLKNSFVGYREGRNVEVLKKLIGEYRQYVSCCQSKLAKDRYNAFVYRYMLKTPVGSRAIATKLNVTKETVWNYIDKCFDEMLMLCMGIVVKTFPNSKEAAVGMLVDGSRLFSSMTKEYILCLFQGKRELQTVEQGRIITKDVMGQLVEATEAYFQYCKEGQTYIDTDVRKAKVLKKCLEGISPAAIASEYYCCERTVYADIRENERRLAAMLFDMEIK